MVASNITILPIYLDGTSERIVSGGVSTLEDDTKVLRSEDNRTVSTFEKSDRVYRHWQLSWSVQSDFIAQLFEVCRNSRGFLFISPLDRERVGTGQPLRNTVTGVALGDGSTTTFQLQWGVSLPYSVGVGTASSDLTDVNYPLSGTVTVYADGVAVPVSSVNLLTGVVTTTTAPASGKVMTASFKRAFPAIITSTSIGQTLNSLQHTDVRSVQIEEVP